MMYIDKYSKHKETHAVNIRFLKDCYKADVAKPLPDPNNCVSSYKDFKKSLYRDGNSGWQNLLFEEQRSYGESRCCYCMRKLSREAGKVNFEHVIPRSLSRKSEQEQAIEYKYYTDHAPALRDYVVMAYEFAKKRFNSIDDIENESKIPHITGLANLVVACNGQKSKGLKNGCYCNGSRGDRRIMPIMLMEKAESLVKYDRNGLLAIDCKDDTLGPIVDELNMDTLQEIRAVWAQLSCVKIDVALAHIMSQQARAIWFKCAYRKNDFTKIPDVAKKYCCLGSEEDFYWKLLLTYDWFYHYPGYAKFRKFYCKVEPCLDRFRRMLCAKTLNSNFCSSLVSFLYSKEGNHYENLPIFLRKSRNQYKKYRKHKSKYRSFLKKSRLFLSKSPC